MGIITKKISELSLLSSPSTTAVLPVQDGNTTYKFELNNIAKTNDKTRGKIENSLVSETSLFYISGIASSNASNDWKNNEYRLVVRNNGINLLNPIGSVIPWNLTFPVSVENGGTGATNKANAIANLMDANITGYTHVFGCKPDWSQSGSIRISDLKTEMNLSDFKCRYLHWGSSITFPAVNSGFVLFNMSAIETFWFPSDNLAHNKIAGGDTSGFTWTHNTTAKTVTISNSSNFTCLVLCV